MSNYTCCKKAYIYGLYDGDMTVKQIGEKMGRADSGIHKVLARHNEEEDPESQKPRGRLSLLTSRDERQLLKTIRKDRRLTLGDITNYAVKNVSRLTVRRADFNSRVAKLKPFLQQRDITQRRIFAGDYLDWTLVRRIISILQLFNIPYRKSKINWENIFCLIQDKKLGIYNVENVPKLYDASSSKTTTSRIASEESSSPSGESSMMKQALLEPEDKIAIKELYKNLNPMNMWKLSSGTIVEKEMEQFALACTYEHPCHSLILDSGDQCWETVFTKEDLKEIKTFNLKRLPNLPTDLENYFSSLLLLSTENDLDKLYTDVKAANFHPRNDEALEWAQTTVLNTIKLFMSNYFPLSDQSEADIIRRIWLLIDTVFDYSAIKSRSGEKSSTSSSDGLNAVRTIANINQAARKLMGRKVDMVYKLQPNEYGCMECGKDGNNSTKEFSDGMFKIPIIMKDMFNSLAKKTPSLVNDITIPSLMIMETKISLIIMDSPGGNVCRISRLKPLYFPVCPLNFMSSLISIMKLVYTARLNMEKTYLLIAKNEPALEYDLGEDPPIPPTFHKNLKRKQDFAEDDNNKSNTEEDDTASNA